VSPVRAHRGAAGALPDAAAKGELLHGSAGTERVELAVSKEIPQARVLRLDRDTSRGKGLIETLAAVS
jgi:primosomal protein N'